jgi:hypothetical protein
MKLEEAQAKITELETQLAETKKLADELASVKPALETATAEINTLKAGLDTTKEELNKVVAEKVTVEALNEKGLPIQITGDGLLARCLQHEIDHLDGKLILWCLRPRHSAPSRYGLRFRRAHLPAATKAIPGLLRRISGGHRNGYVIRDIRHLTSPDQKLAIVEIIR